MPNDEAAHVRLTIVNSLEKDGYPLRQASSALPASIARFLRLNYPACT